VEFTSVRNYAPYRSAHSPNVTHGLLVGKSNMLPTTARPGGPGGSGCRRRERTTDAIPTVLKATVAVIAISLLESIARESRLCARYKENREEFIATP
jgi:hypothetical protein